MRGTGEEEMPVSRYCDDSRGHRRRDDRYERSFQDDRSFREDRSCYGDESRSYYRDRRERTSRPGSRAGSVFYGEGGGRERQNYDRYPRDYMHQSYYGPPPPHHYYYPTAAHTFLVSLLPDQAAMEIFKKHWKYYLSNPGLYRQLQLTNRPQFDSLNEYYRLCGEYLKLPPILPVPQLDYYLQVY